MKKLTDQELDSMFKNAADGYEPAFDQTAWEAMNTKLGEARTTLWRSWMQYTLLGLIVFSTGVWVGIYLNEKASLPQVSFKSLKENINEENNIITEETTNRTWNITDQTTVQKEGESEIKNRLEVMDGNTFRKIITANDHEIQNEYSIIVAGNSNLAIDKKSISQDEKALNEIENTISNPSDSIISEMFEVKTDSSQSNLVNKDESKTTPSHPIFLRALVSPDFSSINYTSTTSIGSNYALLMEYQLTTRWSLSTGGIWAIKKYATNEKFTYGKYTADRMAGDCRILDIPLNVYYRFRPQAKISFSAGVGFSSYIMQEEEYTYTFDSPYGSRDFSDYIKGENKEWFKVLNLSLGMQYQIAPRIHVQAEPFLKAPLSGVGEWDVLLSSMGIFIGLKYKLN